MRALVMTAVILVAGLTGCAQNANRVSAMDQPQLLPDVRAMYSPGEVQAMHIALAQYIKDNGSGLAQYRPVVVSGTVLPAGILEGQSYRPGTALLRQLGYLAFDAPGVQAWIDPAPAGCVRGRCAFVGHLVMAQGHFIVPVDY